MDDWSTSLRTQDQVREGCLLSQQSLFDPQTNCRKKAEFLYELTSLVSPQECQTILQNAQEKFGWTPSRRCIVKCDILSKVLWKRMSPLFLQDATIIPCVSGWKPVGVNVCMRLRHYQAEASGMQPHYDGSFSSSTNRSLYSLLIYLNTPRTGGETVFFQPKSPLPLVSGLTVKEELNYQGGLSKYKHIEIAPVMGNAILFRQDWIHGSNGMWHGDKFILRTDILFSPERDSVLPKQVSLKRKDYQDCALFFQEAQSQSIENNEDKANELYERAISIRLQHPIYLASGIPNKKQHPFFISDLLEVMYSFLCSWDWFAFQLSHRTAQAVFCKIRARRFPLRVNAHAKNSPSSTTKPFIPFFLWRTGNECRFRFHSPDFFQQHLQGCLRVAAMYSVCLFGHVPGKPHFIARYDPITTQVKYVKREALLTRVFYEQPCYGSFFYLSGNEYHENLLNNTRSCREKDSHWTLQSYDVKDKQGNKQTLSLYDLRKSIDWERFQGRKCHDLPDIYGWSSTLSNHLEYDSSFEKGIKRPHLIQHSYYEEEEWQSTNITMKDLKRKGMMCVYLVQIPSSHVIHVVLCGTRIRQLFMRKKKSWRIISSAIFHKEE